MPGVRVGYARVSTDDQDLTVQKKLLVVDKLFEDKLSGKDTDREGFKAMMEYIREGDTLIVQRLDRLSRDLTDLLNIIRELMNRNVSIEFIHEKIVLNNPPTKEQMLYISFHGTFAEYERNVNKERQMAGILLAKKEGKYKGRKPKFTEQIYKDIEKMAAAGIEKIEIAKYLGIGRTSVYNYMKLKGPATKAVMGKK